ncbi:MAG: hypothetical protein HYV28_04620 [Ignavibacteriales bacterium]|nr:hypothetical protein [Ignavibacteriales bacterium]
MPQAKERTGFSIIRREQDGILTPHVESTITRIRNYPGVLAPQDTTTLRYMHPGTEGLDLISASTDNAIRGFRII